MPLGALTFAERGAILFVNGERYNIPAAPATEVEPTGAGDVFAAAFLVRYNLTGDPFEAASYAAAAGALTVEAAGNSRRPDGRASGRTVAGLAAALTRPARAGEGTVEYVPLPYTRPEKP